MKQFGQLINSELQSSSLELTKMHNWSLFSQNVWDFDTVTSVKDCPLFFYVFSKGRLIVKRDHKVPQGFECLPGTNLWMENIVPLNQCFAKNDQVKHACELSVLYNLELLFLLLHIVTRGVGGNCCHVPSSLCYWVCFCEAICNKSDDTGVC